MNTRKQVVSGIIGGIVGSLITALLVSSGTAVVGSPGQAQRDTFAVIRCTALEVIDAAGEIQVAIGTGENGGMVRAYGKKYRKSGALLGAGVNGGMVSVYGEHGELQVGLGAGERGGLLVLMDEAGDLRMLGKETHQEGKDE